MTPEQIAALTGGVADIKTLLTSQGDTIKSQAAQIVDLQAAIAKAQQDFLNFKKNGIGLNSEGRSKRGLGSDRLNLSFGKALVNLVKNKEYDADVFTKAALTDTYVVGVDYANELIRLVEAQGIFRKISRRIPLGMGTTNWPRRTAGVTASHVAGGSAITVSNPTAGQVQLVADTIMGLCILQNSSIEDEVIDLGAFVAEELAYAFATIEDVDAVTGDGTATYGGTKGLLSDALAAVTTNCPKQINMDAGKTAFTDVSFDYLQGLVDSVKSFALVGSLFLMNRTVLSLIRGIKDDQKRPIWEPATSLAAPATILGFPYVLCDAMPARSASAASKRFIVFGNFNYWFFGDRRQYGVVADQSIYRAYDQTAIFATERISQGLSDGGAFAVLATPSA